MCDIQDGPPVVGSGRPPPEAQRLAITTLVIPWTTLLLGFSATLGLCVLAALGPAISTGRAEPAGLLQAGRAAM